MPENKSPKIARYATPEERESIGGAIDPETAWVFSNPAYTVDPYWDQDPSQLPPEAQTTGRVDFAVNEDGVAVSFGDIPAEILAALRRKMAET
jgi:hypothetical protein